MAHLTLIQSSAEDKELQKELKVVSIFVPFLKTILATLIDAP
jgi:hypothetical protein